MSFESLNFADMIESGVPCRPPLFAYRKNAIPQNDLYVAFHQRELTIAIHIIKASYVLRVLEPFPLRYNAFKVLENLSEKCR
jgi:hypothetical protein